MMQGNHKLLACTCIIIAVDVASGLSVAKPWSSVASSSLATSRNASFLLATKGGAGKKIKRAAQTTKGFGAPPATLDDVLASFKSRMPENADDVPCPCGSGEVYGDCCGPLHRGDRICSSMTDVLRSRYTAFSWRNIEYVMATTHESCRDYRDDRVAWAKDLNRNGMFDGFDFVSLSAGEEEIDVDDENTGYVEFKVTFRARGGGGIAGQETVISERSRFLRNPTDGSWSYASGDIRSDVAGLEGAILNK
ncbi:hypothetical protein ACHAXA_004953 [Cyclostephanos tholiformis]|uniref:YchJ-like middle NTF2-like domain-containing protein n=1 Tax=Cyclostephanos tholiformis TaxID=382380 RepID=A0ABD3RTM5_9STRA